MIIITCYSKRSVFHLMVEAAVLLFPFLNQIISRNKLLSFSSSSWTIFLLKRLMQKPRSKNNWEDSSFPWVPSSYPPFPIIYSLFLFESLLFPSVISLFSLNAIPLLYAPSPLSYPIPSCTVYLSRRRMMIVMKIMIIVISTTIMLITIKINKVMIMISNRIFIDL